MMRARAERSLFLTHIAATEGVSLLHDKTVRYVNRAGRSIDEHLIKPGTRIDVYYYGTGETRVVNCVVVDQD